MRTSAALLWALLAAAPAAAAGPSISTSAFAHMDEGLKRLFALDYDASRASFRRVIEDDPDDPFGYLFEAGGIWWQSAQEYGLFKDTPTLQGLFEQDVEFALKKADAFMDSDDKARKADGYYVSGMALGTRGQWNLLKRRYIDAYFDGKKAIKHLKRAVKLDPGYEDAWLGLGVFDYQCARMSGVARLGALLGMRGDQERGLQLMHRAAENGRISSRQAAQFLFNAYMQDLGDHPKAAAMLERLKADFPGSPYFLFMDVVLRSRMGDHAGSLAAARELHRRAAADPAGFRRKQLTLACGLSGADCLSPAAAERALRWLDRALEATAVEKPSSFHGVLRLHRGYALDLLDRHEEAAAEYRRAAALPEHDRSHARARACAAVPCGREALMARLRAMAKGEDPDAGPAAPGEPAKPARNGNLTPKR